MSACRSCNAPIMWAITEATGSRIPLDPTPTEDGRLVLVGRTKGTPVVRMLKKDEQPAVEGLRYTSHFATCPNRDQHRKKPPKPDPVNRRDIAALGGDPSL